MKKAIITVLVLFLLVIQGCAGSPIRTSWQAGNNTKAMLSLQLDMTPEEVINLMGRPSKTEMYRGKSGEPILVYLYITEGMDTYSRRWTEANYTPLVFEKNKLAGWGWNYFSGTSTKHEFTIKNLY